MTNHNLEFPSAVGVHYTCKKCNGEFKSIRVYRNLPPRYCPYCGAEELRERVR